MEDNSGYAVQGGRAGKGYRLDSFDVVQQGRWREFRRTALIAIGLFFLQGPLRSATSGDRASEFPFPIEVPGRLSLVVDIFFVFAYLFLAYRAFGLVRSCRPSSWALRLNQVGLSLVFAGAVLDFWEDIRLWDLLADSNREGAQNDLTLTFKEAFSTGSGDWSFSLLMISIVVAGLVLQAVSFVGYRGARSRKGRPPMAEVADPPSGGSVICCSGGGIRSAAFSLGGLQALTDANVYQKADAVVGVSGGGYMGAAYHVLRWSPADESVPVGKSTDDSAAEWAAEGVEAPFAVGSPEIQWLRRHTRYVLNGARVAVSAGLSLAFGIAVNLLLIASVLGATAWILAWLMLASGRLTTWTDTVSIDGDFASDWKLLGCVWLIPAAGVGLFVLEKIWDRLGTMPQRLKSMERAWTTWLLMGGAVLTALVLGVPWALAELGHYAATSGSVWAGLLHQVGLVPTDVCNTALETSSACGVTRDPGYNVAAASTATVSGVSIASVVGSILAVLASAKSAGKDSKAPGSGVGGFFLKVWNKIKDPIVPWAAVIVVVLAAVVVLLRWVAALIEDPDLLNKWEYAYWFGGLLLATKLVTDANRTSLHHFFRERISYAFLVRRREKSVGPVPYKRPLRFSEAMPPNGKGPRLVACAVANVSDEEIVPSRRGCIPFVFDHERIGLTDRLLPQGAAQRASATYEFAADPRYRDATIPAAVAMSAAAFSPLAGRENVRLGPYRAVLALGNARLGVWLPNPLWVDEVGLIKRLCRLGRWVDAAQIAVALPRDKESGRPWDLRISQDRWARLKGLDDARIDLATATLNARAGIDVSGEQKRRAQKAFEDALTAAETGQSWTWLAMAGELIRNIFKKPGFGRLAKEGFGKASVYDRFLYVTDGGHYDNLGLIEALRRKPDRIYVLDASNDAEDTFRTLGRAIATARIDLDCEVTMDPRGMRRMAETRSGAAWCIGTYKYQPTQPGTPGATGKIFLAKAILLDDLTWDIETYSADNQDFPRTSTSNQLYSEFDFEAYRALGHTAVSRLLGSPDYLQANRTADTGPATTV